MKTAKEIIIAHGGSFEKVPQKGQFWLPLELVESITAWASFLDDLRPTGRNIQQGHGKAKGDWYLFRFEPVRKPYRQFRVRDNSATNNISPELTIRIWPNGVVEIREKGRKSGFQTTVAAVYIRCMLSEAMKRINAKRKKRRARK